ncbi:hypothetical protein ACN47E_000855 [Coniothyrium glycines]
MTQQFATSSATSGFFQALPVYPPQYTDLSTQPASIRAQYRCSTDTSDDRVIARVFELFLPCDTSAVMQHAARPPPRAVKPGLTCAVARATEAEANYLVLRPVTTFGAENKNDPLWTTIGWQELKEVGYQEGIVAVMYNKTHAHLYRRIHQFVGNHLWGFTGTMTSCPQSMTDWAATLLSKHLYSADGDQPGRGKVLREVHRRLISRDSAVAWTSGQWMTERTGGSDVSGTETVATRRSPERNRARAAWEQEFGHHWYNYSQTWKIDGFRWFSSSQVPAAGSLNSWVKALWGYLLF